MRLGQNLMQQGAAGGQISIEYITHSQAVSTDNTTTLTVPADVQQGDILLFSNYVPNYSEGTVPAGFTSLVLTEVSVVDHRTSYKIADGNEGGTTLTGMSGSDYAAILTVFRPSVISSVSSGIWNSEGADNPLAAQTVTPPTDGAIIVFYAAGCRSSTPLTFGAQSPVFDVTITAVDSAVVSLLVGFSLYDFGAVSHTAQTAGDEPRMTFHSSYLQLLP